MANRNSSIGATPPTTLPVDPTPIHSRFSWLIPAAESDENAIFAAHVMTIARGARVIASVLRGHLVDDGAIASGSPDVRPLMSGSDMEALAGLAEASLDALYQAAETRVDFLNDQAGKGAQA